MNEQIGSEAAQLLRGAYDLHIHTAPDLLPRKLDDLEMARRATQRGMAGFAIKSHYFCTAQRAELVNSLYPDCRVIGTVTLNTAVGGINPIAVEMAARAGAKIVWLPTCDAEWEHRQAALEADPAKKPFWYKIVSQLENEGIHTPTIRLLDEGGKLTEAAQKVLEVVAAHGMILATGHISHEETFALAKAARERKVERMVVTHANFPSTFYTAEDQLKLARLGVMMEHCYTTYATGKVDFRVMAEQIRTLGADQVILGTDLGQRTRPYPDEGMYQFICDLLEAGFSPAEVEKMAKLNSARLLN